MSPVEIRRGDGPLVLALPHTGTWLPEAVRARLNERGRRLADTDWHVDRLYEGLCPDATTVRATFHRYAIDANRPPADESLYPGRNTTALVPLTDFDGEPIRERAPDAADVATLVADFHAPYHAALAAELARVVARHGTAILYDCHSIRSVIPFLFDGTLPELNIGTADGSSCDPRVESTVRRACEATGRTLAVNGRFKGGWTTRHHGRPERGVHAIQMELAQSGYLESEAPPFAWDEDGAARLRPLLADVLTRLEALAPELRPVAR